MTEFAFFLGGIITLGFLAAVVLHVWIYSVISISSRKLRAELAPQNRTLSWREARRRLDRNEGLLLVEAPTLGWNVNRIWWAPDQGFLPPPEQEAPGYPLAPQDIENHRCYVDPHTGSASLVDGFVFTQRTKRYLKSRFGREDAAFIPTGAVLWEQYLRQRKEQTSNPPPDRPPPTRLAGDSS